MKSGEPSLILADVISPIVLRNNRFRCDRGWDIDLDDGSSNYHIYNNLCLSGGIKLREGFYRLVENNIMINNSFHPHVWFENSGDVFARNLVMSSYQPIQVHHWGMEVDYNIFTDSVAYKKSRSLNTDAHSVVCTPVFINSRKGDYRIDNHSDAVFRCGFRNFDMDKFGVVSPRLKALARTPQYPNPILSEEGKVFKTIQWKGLQIKDLNTLGERSATGIDSEYGVYVISVDALSGVLRDYIRSNDVILKLGGKPINNLVNLHEVIGEMDLAKPQGVVVFRNQRKIKIVLPANILK